MKIRGREYVTGVGRSPEETKKVTHLYKGSIDNPGLPMCKRGWNRGDGYSIWRNNISDKGICKICLRRANEKKPGVKYKKTKDRQ